MYVFGAWQFKSLPLLLIAIIKRHQIYYSPKGQLCEIEFTDKRCVKWLYLLLIESLVIFFASKVILNSKIEKTKLVQPIAYLAKNKIEIVPEGLYYESYVKEIPQPTARDAHTLRLGIIAKFSARKQLDNAIKIVRELRTQGDLTVSLEVIGEPTPAYRQQWNSIQQTVRNDDDIHFHGAKTGEFKWNALKDVDCFLIPSVFESFGLVVLESALLQRKMLVSKNVGALEHLDDTLYGEFPLELTDLALKNIIGYLTSKASTPATFAVDEYNESVRKQIIDIHKGFY